MTSIVNEMLRLAAGPATFDWNAGLRSDDRGERLAAYAYLYARPTCSAADVLVRVLIELEDKPFGQYWALKALRRVLSTCDPDTAQRAVQDLGPFGEGLRWGTDRRKEFDELQRDLERMLQAARQSAGTDDSRSDRLTEANIGAATSGPDISEEEHEITLHEESPVVEKWAVPRERVRLDKETVTEQEQVGGEVRKEQVERRDDLDELLDDIADVLEEDPEEFRRQYRQKGGE